MNFTSSLFTKTAFYIALAFFAVLYILSFLFYATGDEAILAEQAQMLCLNGGVSSPMYEGIGQGWEDIQLHYHKLFIWIGAIVYSFFGPSLYAFKAVSLLFLIGTMILLRSLFVHDGNKRLFGFFFVLLLINHVFFVFGLMYRPETMVMFFAVLTYWLLEQYQKNGKWSFVAYAAISAGAGALSHLNGLSICFAGFVLLLLSKRYFQSLVFGIVSGVTSLLYFIDINTKAKFGMFLQQFSNDPNLDSTDLSLFGPVIKLANEHMRYFWNAEVSTFSILLIVVLLFSIRGLWKNHGSLIVFAFSIAIALGAIAQGKTIKYGLIVLPFYIMIIVYGVQNILDSRRTIVKVLLSVFLVIYCGVNIYAGLKITSTFHKIHSRSEFIAGFMPEKNIRIYAPDYFFFKQGENFKISHPFTYDVLTQNYLDNTQQSAEGFYEFNYNLGAGYIVLDSLSMARERFNISDYNSIQLYDTVFNYVVIQDYDTWKLLKRLD